MGNVSGITKYDSIRRYLEQIYLYGFFSREDWISLGKEKDYDKIIALIREIYPELDEDAIWRDRKKYLRFQREYSSSGTNLLMDTYMLHAMDEKEELPELLRVLSFVSDAPRSLQDIARWVETFEPEETRDMYALIRRRTQELEKYGYLHREKSNYYGRLDTLYSIQDNILDKLNDDELIQLYQFICFAAGVTFPRVAASYLLRSIERRMPETPQRNPLLLRHYDRRSVFDEDVVYTLLAAIENQQKITAQKSGTTEKVYMIPVAIRVDARLGRWYVLGMEEKPAIYRISLLEQVKTGTVVDKRSWENARSSVLKVFEYAAFSGQGLQDPPQLVEAELHFKEAPGMYLQFCREMRLGEIIKEENREVYRVWIHDPGELVPFLRSFAPWLKVLPGRHNLDEKIKSDLEKMKRAMEE